MIRLRVPISITASTRVGAGEWFGVDNAVAFAVPAVAGGLFGVVLWGLNGALIGSGLGGVVGYAAVKMRQST